MEPVRIINGTAVPLDRSDVDTDQIIPSDWLKRVERTGFSQGLFSQWREDDPEFVLNRPQFNGACILVAGPNFGVGSSREHAVWALMDYGFKAVIAPRFGDIFRNNSTKTGLITCAVDAEASQAILRKVEADPSTEITIDVEKLVVVVPTLGLEASFYLDAFTQHRLLNGLDDIGVTLQHGDDIDSFEARRPAWLPSTAKA
jgi:3-isopropylmalate/(R)-2-methylmalate dehydratase small subunit